MKPGSAFLRTVRHCGLVLLLTYGYPPGALAAKGPDLCKTRHVVIVTIDGLRWQEVFGGIDPDIYREARWIRHPRKLAEFLAKYRRETPEAQRAALLPFFWSELASRGQLYGDRSLGSDVRVLNPYRFSYPGYSEILTGIVDPRIASNERMPNPNRTVLEWLNQQPEFAGQVAAFGSWDVFPYILHARRAGFTVNAGFAPLQLSGNDQVTFLNRLQEEIPSPWDYVRLDTFTHHFAMAYLTATRPRVLLVALGEPDDFAHDGQYDQYVRAATRNDRFIAELWAWLQADSEYRDTTTMIVTTDHGRGRTTSDWTSHGAGINPSAPDGFPGDDETWLAIIGPDTPPRGAVAGGDTIFAASVASTVAAAMGMSYESDHPSLRAAPAVSGAIACAAAAP